MATVVASRFACLKIEGDDEPAAKKNSNKEKKPKSTNQSQNQKKTDKKNKNTKTAQQPNGNSNPNKKKKKQSQPKSDNWEQWKQKDSEIVDEHFKEDLQQAMILSKLAFEEQQNLLKSVNMQMTKINSEQILKNKKMTLGQFNMLVDQNINGQSSNPIAPVQDLHKEENLQTDCSFFDRIKEDMKVELVKNKHHEIRIPAPSKQPTDDEIVRSQFKAALEFKDNKIHELEALVEHLKVELFKTRDRNRQLCRIMSLAEMKEKAEILIQVERLHTVQEELTGEISTLHAQLEQERSRCSSYKADYKYKDKKRRMTEKEN